MLSQRTYEITDPAMAPIKAWIESYVVWTDLPPYTRASILKRTSKGDEAAIEALCNHNLRLVLSRAVKHLGRGVPLPDLIQEGWLGLRLAAQKYEPERGRQFSTMAVNWIDQKLNNAHITQGRTVYLPHKADERLARITARALRGEELRADDQAWMDRLARQLSKNPKLHNVTIDYFDHLVHGTASLDKPIANVTHSGAEHYHTLADIIPAPAARDTTESFDLEAVLLEMVNREVLTRRQGWLLVRHFGLDGEGGRNYIELAQELHDAEVRWGRASDDTKPLSRERIRQILTVAMRKVRIYAQAKYTSTFVSPPAHGTLRGQTKRLSSASITGQSDSTESPKTRSTRRTSVDLSQETAASQPAATPLRLPAHSSTKRAKRSSRTNSQVSGVDVPYAEAI